MLDLSEPLLLAPLLVFIFIFIFIFLHKWLSTFTQSSPPSPPKLPILGNLHQLGLHPHRSLSEFARIHGPYMLLHFGTIPVLVVSSAEGAHEIMRTHDLAFADRPKSFIYQKLLYDFKDVTFAPYGEYWRQMKSLCVLNLLSTKRVRSFRVVREEEVKSMLQKIRDLSSSSTTSKVLNLSEMFVTLTNDVISRVALGRRHSSGGEDLIKLLEEFTELLGHINVRDYLPWLAWLNRLNGLDARLDKVAKRFDVFLEKVIQEHVDSSQSIENDKNVGHSEIHEQKDFVDVLLEIQNDNSLGFPLDRVSIKALILDMFTAGTGTTFSFLEWAVSELLRHPKAMKKLQNEIRTIIGDNSEYITEDDLAGMHYLKAVIKEIFRLHPPAPTLIPRKSNREVEINGYKIKANTQVIVNAWHIGRDPNTYKNPEEFEPERFMIHNSNIDYKGNDFNLIPFGAGRRICPAIQFSMCVSEMALANLVHKFDLELPDGANGRDLDMTEASGITTQRKHPLEVVAVQFCH